LKRRYDLTDADVDRVLFTALQGDAANYDQFKVRQE
jgi:hypothetical protein